MRASEFAKIFSVCPYEADYAVRISSALVRGTIRMPPLPLIRRGLSGRAEKKRFAGIARLQRCDFSAVLLSLLTKFEREVYWETVDVHWTFVPFSPSKMSGKGRKTGERGNLKKRLAKETVTISTTMS